jgi:hypothetical protein
LNRNLEISGLVVFKRAVQGKVNPEEERQERNQNGPLGFIVHPLNFISLLNEI